MANDNTCVCCGEIIPEGTMVCPNCLVVSKKQKKRLIDANYLDKEMRKLALRYAALGQFEAAKDYNFVRTVLETASTVDAVEVVHGRWEDEHGGKYANPRYRCSVCKAKALYKFERDLLDNWKEVQTLTPICPYCMAKLDGGTFNDI